MIETDVPAAVAALSGTVAAFGVRLAVEEGKTEGKASRAELEALAERFEALSHEVSHALEEEASKNPAAICWPLLSNEQRESCLSALGAWVDSVLVPGYPSAGLRDCWRSHPEAVTELSNIWLAWIQAYERKKPNLDLALAWHERWMPGAVKRIYAATERCIAGCRMMKRET